MYNQRERDRQVVDVVVGPFIIGRVHASFVSGIIWLVDYINVDYINVKPTFSTLTLRIFIINKRF